MRILLKGFILLTLVMSCAYIRKSETYYGIKTASKRICFLIDISGSMEGKTEVTLQEKVVAEAAEKAGEELGEKVGGKAGKFLGTQLSKELTKLAKAKKELIPAIRGLSGDTYFTVIAFEAGLKAWKPALVQATTTNKNLAIIFVNGLKSGGGTNIYEALEKAFALAGNGATDTTQTLGVEAVFLLTDGEPSAGAITSTSGILQKVAEWNPLHRIVINTIGLGKDQDESFLMSLASQNSGQYVKR